MVQAKAKYWEMLWHYRRFASVVFLLAALGTYAVFYMQPTVYGVQADLYLPPRRAVGESAASLSGERLHNHLEILRSDRVREKAFKAIKTKLGKRFNLSPQELQQALNVAQKGTSSVIALEMHAPVSPRDLRAMVSEYIHTYQDMVTAMEAEASKQDMTFWQHSLDKAQRDAETALEALSRFEAAYPSITFREAASSQLQTSQLIEAQLIGVKADMDAAKAEMDATSKLMPLTLERVAALSRVEADLEAGELRRRIVALEMAWAEWAAQVPETDPKMVILQGEINRAKTLLNKRLQVLDKGFGQKESLNAEAVITAGRMDGLLSDRTIEHQLRVDGLTAKAQSLTDARKHLLSPQNPNPQLLVEYANLQKQAQTAQDKVRLLQRRLDDAVLTGEIARQFEPVEILNNPELRVRPFPYALALHLVASGLAGLLLALCGVGVRVAVDHRLRGSFQLGELAEKRVFCLDKLPSRKVLSALLERGNFKIPEPYQRLMLYLETLAQTERVRRIGLMPVGAFPDRALPIISLGLYCTEPGYKVALIDTDFSKQSTSRLIESLQVPLSRAIEEGPGLSDYLAGESVDFVDIIYPLGKTVAGSLIPAGEPISAASGQMSRRGIVHLEEQLSPNYNFVFYGLPALAESYDSVAVGRILDGVMLVVYPGISSLAQIKRTIQELDAVDARLLGIIVQPV